MRTIYAVTSGMYSDYTVHGLFENEADAQAVADNWRGSRYSDADIENFTLYAPGERPEQFVVWTAWNYVAADKPEMRSQVITDWGGNERQFYSDLKISVTPPYQTRRFFTDQAVQVSGLDKDEVIRVWHEKVAEVRASQ